MFKHNLITALRGMRNQKMQTIILVSGMALGLTACFWMAHWLLHEFHYERIHENADRIFRVELEMHNPEGISLGAATPTPLAPLLKQEYPEVLDAARLHQFAETTMHFRDHSFSEDHIMAADPSILSMFTFTPIYGALNTALQTENSVVITES
ncbi:MAG TPA: ABC transporter permease, partial [Balneolaceae bacterium]|nr:ABC transporter permease [Balneolaceae bacterium]